MNNNSKIIAPLIIFSEDNFDKLELSNEICIRKITNEEIKDFFKCDVTFKDQRANSLKNRGSLGKIWDDLPIQLPLNHLIYFIPYYVIEAVDRSNIEFLILTLHLLKNESFLCPKGRQKITNGWSDSIYYPLNFVQRYNYKIKTKDREEIKTLYSLILQFDNKKNDIIKGRLKICFDYSQNKKIRFIECVSVIESILCGNDSGELRFRFSLFATFMLKKLSIDVSHKDISIFYDIRSKLVHTGEAKKYNNELLDTLLTYPL